MLLGMLGMALTYLLLKGTGIWGVNIPVGWGFAIINFVWWIGIGHAGTLISAILLLFKQDWRTSINRFAEAMTLFAVACALIFPLVHTGRPWLAAYWLLPVPEQHGRLAAVPQPADLGRLRGLDLRRRCRCCSGTPAWSPTWRRCAIGPRTSGRRGCSACSRSAGAVRRGTGRATRRPTCCWPASRRRWSSRSTRVVSFDFAIGMIPGWHATIFPPYFVAGAIYAGFAMVLTLAIPLRVVYGLEDFITMRHLENMGKVMLVTGLIVGYGYMMEAFFGYYSANQYEGFMIWNRMTGPYAPFYWALIFCNIVTPQFLWIKKRAHQPAAAVRDRDGRQRRHVARALRHRRHQPAPRLPAVVVGHVLADAVGLDDVLRHHRPVPDAVLPVHPGAADDFDLRDADDRAGSEDQGREGALSAAMPETPAIYGLMAEFDDPTALVAAARRTREAGYRGLRRVLAVPDPRAVRRDALRGPPGAAVRAARRDRRRADRLRAAGLGLGDRLPAEHRRQALYQLADVHPGHLRADDPVRVDHRGAVVDRAERAAAALSPGVQRRALRDRTPARPGSSWRSSATDPKFERAQTFEFLKGLGAKEINEVEA